MIFSISNPGHVVEATRRYILACERKFTGRRYGTARALLHYRGLLERYVQPKRKMGGQAQ